MVLDKLAASRDINEEQRLFLLHISQSFSLLSVQPWMVHMAMAFSGTLALSKDAANAFALLFSVLT